MLGVILAAGRGTRLGQLTTWRSKAMLPVVGKPLVARVLDSLIAAGIDDVIIVVAAEDEELRNYFATDDYADVRIRLTTQAQPRGMADALRCASPLITGDFVLSACDSLVPGKDVARLVAHWQGKPESDGLLALLRVLPSQLGQSGVVALDGEHVRRIIEKPRAEEAPSDIISLPLYVFGPRLLGYLSTVQPSTRGEYELQDAVQQLIDAGGAVYGMTVSGRLTVTTPADLLAVNIAFLQQRGTNAPRRQQSPAHDIQLIEPVAIDQDVALGSRCVIGPNVYLERGCIIGEGVRLRDAVVLRGAIVPSGAIIVNQVVAEPIPD